MTDGQLVRAYVGGDQQAFAELVQRHAHWVWGCALRQVRDTALAEDITQGAFILLARKAASLPAGVAQHGLPGWLFRVVHYLARDARKTSARRQFHEARVAAMQRDETGPARNWDAIHALLDAAVAKLRDQDRHAVLLRFYQQMSLGEVAQALQVSEASAAKRVSRAVDRLRAVLAGQGYRSAQEVQEVLEAGLACTAPAALVAQIAAGSHSATGILLAAKAAKMLLAAKLKVAAVVVGATVLAGGVLGGAVTAAHHPAPTAPAAPAPAAEPAVQAPPIRPEKKAVAVCLAVVTLPQNSLDGLLASTQSIKLDPDLETRLGEGAQVRPILRDLLARYGNPSWQMQWNRWGRAKIDDMEQRRELASRPAQGLQPAVRVSTAIQVDGGDVTQVAGGYTIQYEMGDPGPLPSTTLAFTPQAFRPGQVLVQIVRGRGGAGGQQDPRVDRALLMIYEAVTTDASDSAALSNLASITSWYAKPINEHLRVARAGAVWAAMAPAQPSAFVPGRWGKTLPSGAQIWISAVSNASVHPIGAWLPDGRPARLTSSGLTPTADLRIVDPNLPPQGGPESTFTLWTTVPLEKEANGGYAIRIGFGDGPYKPVGRIPLKDGATLKVGNGTVRLASVTQASGEYVLDGVADTDVALVALGKDGKRFPDHSYSHRWRVAGGASSPEHWFGFDVGPDQIEAIEVGTRPLVWVDFDSIAKRPTVPLPTGYEPPPADEATRMDAAVPTDRKAFLEQVQCIRFWMDSPNYQKDVWAWRDGRYRSESWAPNTHSLYCGDGQVAAEYDFAAGTWSPTDAHRPDEADFSQLLRLIGAIEHTLAIGEAVGQEKVEGVDCTIRKAKQEATESRVWVDRLGLIHRIEFTRNRDSATISYNPPSAERVWTAPAIADQRPFEQLAEEYLAKAVPITKPLFAAEGAGREMQVLSISRIQNDMVLFCTSTQLDPEARKHREQTQEKWLATQLAGCGPGQIAWSPRTLARLHMPYREITWWVAKAPKDHPDPDLLELLVWLGRPSPADEMWTMEPWMASRPKPTRMHLLQLDLASVEREDTEVALRRIYAVLEGYRALGNSAKNDLITACGSWEEFRPMSESALTGTRTILESGR